MCAAQALDYRAPLRPGLGARLGHQAVRELVAPLAGDRVLSADIETLANAVAAGRFAPASTVPLLAPTS
jgi:histidine ammonia-lyase